MAAQNAISSSQASRLETLRQKHADLSRKIEREQAFPGATDFYLRQLKKRKLMLKEQIEFMGEGAASAS